MPPGIASAVVHFIAEALINERSATSGFWIRWHAHLASLLYLILFDGTAYQALVSSYKCSIPPSPHPLFALRQQWLLHFLSRSHPPRQ